MASGEILCPKICLLGSAAPLFLVWKFITKPLLRERYWFELIYQFVSIFCISDYAIRYQEILNGTNSTMKNAFGFWTLISDLYLLFALGCQLPINCLYFSIDLYRIPTFQGFVNMKYFFMVLLFSTQINMHMGDMNNNINCIFIVQFP